MAKAKRQSSGLRQRRAVAILPGDGRLGFLGLSWGPRKPATPEHRDLSSVNAKMFVFAFLFFSSFFAF